jgi:hypothetical protein
MRALILATAFLAVSCVDKLSLTPDVPGRIVAFEVEGQTGIAAISPATRTVGIEVEGGVDLAAVTVTRIELVETATCNISAGDVLDLTSPRRVTVTTAADYEWTIVATQGFDPERPLPGGAFDEWSSTGSRPTWNPWPRGPETDPKPEDGRFRTTRWWDTGNKGVNILGASNSTPTEPGTGCPGNASGRAARLETRWVGNIKVAGGNIYFGRFGGLTTDGSLNATCDIGHPWRAKPRGLKGWFRYFPQRVDRVADDYLDLHPYGFTRDRWMGSMDSLHINIALWASPDGANVPFTVNTSPKSFLDFRRDTPGVIAYGSFVSGEEQADWAQFSLPLEYLQSEYSPDSDAGMPLPPNTQLFLQVTSSKNCNYFIAGTSGGPNGEGSLMYVDEFELEY